MRGSSRVAIALLAAALVPSAALGSENEDIAQRFTQAFASGDVAVLEEIVAEDVLDHNTPPGSPPGREGLLGAVALYHTWFPDVAITVEQQVAQGDLVAQYGRVSGTNTGAIFDTTATGKRADFAYMDIYRIANGRIVETWHVEDIAGMLGQLGIALR